MFAGCRPQAPRVDSVWEPDMQDKQGCGAIGCVLPLILILLALGYYAYTNRQLNVVYKEGTAQETLDGVRNNAGR